jgi:hypothetical protein
MRLCPYHVNDSPERKIFQARFVEKKRTKSFYVQYTYSVSLTVLEAVKSMDIMSIFETFHVEQSTISFIK